MDADPNYKIEDDSDEEELKRQQQEDGLSVPPTGKESALSKQTEGGAKDKKK